MDDKIEKMRKHGIDLPVRNVHPEKPTLVVYHANCPDGFCAAWVASKSLPAGTEFYAAHYGGELPDFTDRNVMFLDWCPKLHQMPLLEVARSVVCLDHHITSKLEAEKLGGTFDITKSGAMLTWEHFNPGIPAPDIVKYVQDRDLWKWDLEYSKGYSAALSTYPYEFGAWDKFNALTTSEVLVIGAAITRYQDKLVESHVKHARLQQVCGHEVLVANATVLFSEIGEALAKNMPFGATYFDRADGKRQWSLRSRGDGGLHVGDLAKTMGGGGHPNAAGFETIL
jgi:hypothetical protein